MPGLERSEERIDQEPFVIRGHHLPYFTMLVNGCRKGDTPEKLARYIRREVEISLDETRYNPNNGIRQKQEEYVRDIFGSSLGQADKDKFEAKLVQIFTVFLYLPNNHPAEIVEEVPDVICAACVVGKHCHPSKSNVAHTPVIYDAVYVDAFLRRIRGINYLSRLREEDQLPELTLRRQPLFPDTEISVRKIRTTLDVVKKVLTRNPHEKNIIFRYSY